MYKAQIRSIVVKGKSLANHRKSRLRMVPSPLLEYSRGWLPPAQAVISAVPASGRWSFERQSTPDLTARAPKWHWMRFPEGAAGQRRLCPPILDPKLKLCAFVWSSLTRMASLPNMFATILHWNRSVMNLFLPSQDRRWFILVAWQRALSEAMEYRSARIEVGRSEEK